MAATKTTKTKGRTTKKKTKANNFHTEILLLVVFAACLILMISNFGLGGFVGDAISSFCFGAVGILAYIFPVLLFIGAAFLISNNTNILAYKKFFAGVVFFVFLCGFVQLLTEGYMRSTTLLDYYTLCSDYRTGGGVVGGAICISTTSAFGVVGGYVIIVLVLIISLIIVTQRSFFGFMNKIGSGIVGLFVQGHEKYKEGAPERAMKKELRAKERIQRKEEKLRRLEEELAMEEEEMEDLFEEENSSSAKKGNKGKTAKTEEKSTAAFKRPSFLQNMKFSVPDLKNDVFKPLEEDDLDTQEAGSGQIEFKINRPVPEEDLDLDDEEEEEELPPFQESKAKAQPLKKPKSDPKEVESGIENIQQEIKKNEPAVKKKYQFPPLKLLKRGSSKKQGDSDEYLRKTAQKLEETLHNFGVNVTVTNVSCGPTVTRYELHPEMGVKVSKIVSLADDIKLNLATPDIRIEAPIPGKAAVGIEVPNKENSAVMLRDLLQSSEFQNAKSKLSFAVGKDIAGKPVVTDIAKMPHLLIAGATGSGKSVCINTLIMSILYKATPDEVKLIMIDPKVVELSVYNGIPHLFIPVVTDPKKAAGALNWAVSEMTSRYNTFAEYGVRNLKEYNKKIETMRFPEEEERPEKMPQIVIIVDELADLMMVAPGEVEDAICRLAQLARAAGIHLIIATQRPSVNVITGLIKANMPSRIAFSVSSGVDSRTILDMNGAEKLLGKGDMLFYPQGYQKPARLQGSFVSDEEVSAVVHFLADKNPAVEYDPKIEEQVNTASAGNGGSSGNEERDIYFEEAGKFIIEKEKASIGMLQRMFKIGFNRAARIMDQLCDAGVVGPEEGTKPRKVLMTMDEFQTYIEENL